MLKHWRPSGYMNGLVLKICVVLEKRLRVFPARQSANSPNALNIYNIGQGVASSFAKYGSLHMCSLEFPPMDFDFTISSNDGL
jgi:hypothetical protein